MTSLSSLSTLPTILVHKIISYLPTIDTNNKQESYIGRFQYQTQEDTDVKDSRFSAIFDAACLAMTCKRLNRIVRVRYPFTANLYIRNEKQIESLLYLSTLDKPLDTYYFNNLTLSFQDDLNIDVSRLNQLVNTSKKEEDDDNIVGKIVLQGLHLNKPMTRSIKPGSLPDSITKLTLTCPSKCSDSSSIISSVDVYPKNLKTLTLSTFAKINFPIPQYITSLYLYQVDNSKDGSLDELVIGKSLESLYLSSYNGKIKRGFFPMDGSLQELKCENVTGIEVGALPPSLKALYASTIMDPFESGKLPPGLEILVLSGNQSNKSIGPNILPPALTHLQIIVNGKFFEPGSLDQCRRLTKITVSNTNFAPGVIPSWITEIKSSSYYSNEVIDFRGNNIKILKLGNVTLTPYCLPESLEVLHIKLSSWVSNSIPTENLTELDISGVYIQYPPLKGLLSPKLVKLSLLLPSSPYSHIDVPYFNVNELPQDHLRYLTLTGDYSGVIEFFNNGFRNLTYLSLPSYTKLIKSLPPNLTHLVVSNRNSHILPLLPNSLKSLEFLDGPYRYGTPPLVAHPDYRLLLSNSIQSPGGLPIGLTKITYTLICKLSKNRKAILYVDTTNHYIPPPSSEPLDYINLIKHATRIIIYQSYCHLIVLVKSIITNNPDTDQVIFFKTDDKSTLILSKITESTIIEALMALCQGHISTVSSAIYGYLDNIKYINGEDSSKKAEEYIMDSSNLFGED